jgi:hypothetical protein
MKAFEPTGYLLRLRDRDVADAKVKPYIRIGVAL